MAIFPEADALVKGNCGKVLGHDLKLHLQKTDLAGAFDAGIRHCTPDALAPVGSLHGNAEFCTVSDLAFVADGAETRGSNQNAVYKGA